MIWTDGLQPAAFRGVPFFVDSAEASFGRRTARHEFPGAERVVIEDLGRKTRELTIECFVLDSPSATATYMDARDALIAAAEKPGAGTLDHPYLGTMEVFAQVLRVRESTRKGGMAQITLGVIEAGELEFPDEVNTAALVTAAADAAEESALAAFVAKFKAAGRLIESAQAEVDRALADVSRFVADVTGPLAALVRTPANLAAAIVGALKSMRGVALTPLKALDLYKGSFGAGKDPTAASATTPTRRQEAANTAAINDLVRRAAVAEACRAAALAPAADFGSGTDALAVLALLADALDALMEREDPVTGAPIDDATYAALAALRAALVHDLTARAATLPRLASYTSPATLPALVLAHRLYGDATRDAEIAARNAISHPLFMPGGVALEVFDG